MRHALLFTALVTGLLQVAAPNTSALDEVLDQIGAMTGVRSSESLIHLSTRIDRAV